MNYSGTLVRPRANSAIWNSHFQTHNETWWIINYTTRNNLNNYELSFTEETLGKIFRNIKQTSVISVTLSCLVRAISLSFGPLIANQNNIKIPVRISGPDNKCDNFQRSSLAFYFTPNHFTLIFSRFLSCRHINWEWNWVSRFRQSRAIRRRFRYD